MMVWFWFGLLSAEALYHRGQGAELLRPGPAVELRLAAGGSVDYRFPDLGPMQVIVDQGDWDYSIELRDSAGTTLLSSDGFEWGLETITLQTCPQCFLTVRRDGRAPGPAHATLRLQPWAGSQADLATRSAAERLTNEVRQLRRKDDGVSKQKAVEECRKAISMWETLGDRSAVERLRNIAGILAFGLARYEEALSLLDRAIEESRALGDRRGMAVSLNNRGSVWRQKGALAQARFDMEAAEAIFRTLPRQYGRGATLTNLGVVCLQTGDLKQAVRYLAEAMPLHRAAHFDRGEAAALHVLGLTQATLGILRQARGNLQTAAARFRAAGDWVGESRSLSGLARVRARLGDLKQAEQDARRSLDSAQKTADKKTIAEHQQLLADICLRTGQLDEALRLAGSARETQRTLADRYGEASSLETVGAVQAERGDVALGIQHLRESLRLYQETAGSLNEAGVLYQLARLYQRAGDLNSARDSILSSIELLDRARGKAPDADLRITYTASVQDYYETAVDILASIALQGDQEQARLEAWRMAERGRARALYDTIRDSKPVDGPAIAAWEEVRGLEARISYENSHLMRGLKGPSQQSASLGELYARLDRATATLNQLDARRRAIAASPAPQIAAANDVLQDGLAVLEYQLGAERSFLWLITADGVRLAIVPPRSVVEAQVKRLTAVLAAKAGAADPAEFAHAARSLARSIIDPARLDSRVHRILVVAGGALDQAPFAALPDEKGRPLVDRFEIAMAPSVTTARALMERRHARTPGHGMLVLADPVFSPTDARLTSRVRGGESLGRLPFSAREAAAVKDSVGSGRARVLLGFAATRDALTSDAARNSDVVHISTHAVLAANRPKLVLSQLRRDGTRRRGDLTAEEAAGLDLNARLVVLSACDTAAGRRFAGEGAMSLARSFLAAGADSVIASLWQVDDEATASLFSEFYRRLRQSREHDPIAALRSAQNALRRDARWRSPLYWAAFVLSGPPQSSVGGPQ